MENLKGRLVDRREALHHQLAQGVAQLGLTLPAAALAHLLDYLALLERWNAAYNLTAVRRPEEMLTRHLLDALAVLPFVQGERLADLGSGAGLPGVVLAIAMPKRPTVLVDSNGKKVHFLRAVVRGLKLENVRVVQSRVEQMEACFDCITTRAFASLADMLRWGGHLLAHGGRWLAMKGPCVNNELPGIGPDFVVCHVHQLDVPGLHARRQLVVLAHA